MEEAAAGLDDLFLSHSGDNVAAAAAKVVVVVVVVVVVGVGIRSCNFCLLAVVGIALFFPPYCHFWGCHEIHPFYCLLFR